MLEAGRDHLQAGRPAKGHHALRALWRREVEVGHVAGRVE
jgi:hypothetical protein